MNSDSIAQLNVSSSKLAKEWVRQIQAAAPEVFSLDSTFVPDVTTPSVSVVQVPDLSTDVDEQIASMGKTRDSLITPDAQSVEADTPTDPYRDAIALIVPHDMPNNIAIAKPVVETEVVNRDLPVAETAKNPVADLPISGPSNELSEKPSDWIDPSSDKRDSSRSSTSAGDSMDPDAEAISQLVDQILLRYPLLEPTTLLFTGATDLPFVEETCAQVAEQLSERNIGKVLLVDSELKNRELSKAGGLVGADGLTNILFGNEPWRELVIDECKTPMDFLPVGCESQVLWTQASENKSTFLAETKLEYQFVCISAGDAHSDSAAFWAEVCDGTFVIVNMESTSQLLARSAVDQLRINNGRVLGCIAVESKNTIID